MVATTEAQIEMVLKPVGVVRSEVTTALRPSGREDLSPAEKIEKSRQYIQKIRDLVCELVIDPELDGILDGIEAFSHIHVLYWPHLLAPERRSLTRVHPMGRHDLPLTGIFATRSPARPNPILLTTVQLLSRRENVLVVKGLEAADGSPIVDIKPYSAIRPEVEHPRFPDWLVRIDREIAGNG